jgi:hypothetical protein
VLVPAQLVMVMPVLVVLVQLTLTRALILKMVKVQSVVCLKTFSTVKTKQTTNQCEQQEHLTAPQADLLVLAVVDPHVVVWQFVMLELMHRPRL